MNYYLRIKICGDFKNEFLQKMLIHIIPNTKDIYEKNDDEIYSIILLNENELKERSNIIDINEFHII